MGKKILFIGKGGISKKHQDSLEKASEDIICKFYSRRAATSSKESFQSLQEAITRFIPDICFICTETSQHYEDLKVLLEMGFENKIYVEKPLVMETSHLEKIKGLIGLNKSQVFITYNLRFHPYLQKLKNIIEKKKEKGELPICVNAYVGQYLPSWRPERDYRDSYSAKKNQGGGVLRDLSHELDYLCWLLGAPLSLIAIGGKLSQLEIETEDTASIFMKMPNCPHLNLHLNYLRQRAKRELEINYTHETWVLDFVKGDLKKLKGSECEVFSPSKISETYFSQAKAMIDADDNHQYFCTLEEGMNIVKLICEIEKYQQGK